MTRHAAGVAAGAALLLTLTACAGPDPDAATRRAQEVFTDIVAAVAAVDPTTLRTLEVAPSADLRCHGGDGVQRVFSATGTLAVGVDEDGPDTVLEAVRNVLAAGEWDRIRAGGERAQIAWIDRGGTVATFTADAPVMVVSVSTPCLR